MEEDKRIILNRIKTPDGTILISRHRHDYVTHTDKNGHTYMVDGGNEYLRRNYIPEAPHIEMNLYEDAPFEEIRQHLCRGGRGKNGDQPLKWVPLCEMSNDWVEACIEYNGNRGLINSYATEMYEKELVYRKDNNIFIDDLDGAI